MSLLVVGSMALDTIETPFGKAEYTLGGSATFLSTSASYFINDIKLVGVVGYDFPQKEIDFLQSRGIDTAGVEILKDVKTFHWHGKYHYDMNTRDSITTELNALGVFDPKIPDDYKACEYICLGNIDPNIQQKVIKQISNPQIVMCDTMNFWIEGMRDEVVKTLGLVDVLVINDSEARLLTGEYNLITAYRKMREMGPKVIVIKKGEHGAYLFTDDAIFSAPAYPLEQVFDPTGAGDTFAGGMMGWLCKSKSLTEDNLKLSVIYGSTMASLCVEEFSLEGIRNLSQDKIRDRFNAFKRLTHFESLEIE
ncbi:MAG: sugar kinase [Ignavibacteria bacterium]|nr:sugar kinase [Ignavibacteria bacterium]